MTTFLPNNQIQLLRNGEAYFPALITAINNASHSVYLLTYIYEIDKAGISVGDALKQAAQRGVTVNVLLDGFGCKDMPKAYLTELENAGVRVLFYRPKISPWTLKKSRLRRLHRKIALVDSTIAFVGGINIIDDYNVPDNTPPRIDYAVRIEGTLLPIITKSVQKLLRRLSLSYLKIGNSVTTISASKSETVAIKGVDAAFVLRDNVLHRRDIEDAYLDAINAAQSEIIIANAYFVPGRRFRQALLRAAKRGVKIELLLQGRMEYFLMFATHAFYSLFLKNGVQIFEYRKSFMHCKVAVIDGYWATVGSSNIDPFSMMLAREANIAVQNAEFAQELRAEICSTIREGAHQVSADEWLHGHQFKRALSWLVYGLVRWGMGLIGLSRDG
ncbi:MAG: cardiolipin synthase ClsB [Bdellovibrio sp.]|nr:cardiolipin synthase ClsB [Methylotenera sp.]